MNCSDQCTHWSRTNLITITARKCLWSVRGCTLYAFEELDKVINYRLNLWVRAWSEPANSLMIWSRGKRWIVQRCNAFPVLSVKRPVTFLNIASSSSASPLCLWLMYCCAAWWSTCRKKRPQLQKEMQCQNIILCTSTHRLWILKELSCLNSC